jgi:hypothetical protein
MNSIALCEWRTFYAAVLFETDEARFESRITDALRTIDERLQSVGEMGSIERISIENAQRGLAAMEREPFFVSRPRPKKAVILTGSDVPDAEVKRTQYGIGAHVRVTLPSGELIAAEIVVIFTASTGKNILVSFDNHFTRIGTDQILDCISAKA